MASRARNAWLTSLTLVLWTTPASATEFGLMRAMQSGPIGDAPAMAGLEKIEAEAQFSLYRTFGNYTLNDDTDSRASATGVKSRVAAGGGFSPTKQFSLSGFIDATVASDYDENQTRGTYDSTYDSGLYRHELALFGMFKTSGLVFGGGMGLVLIGSETKEFEYDDDKYELDIGSAAMPVLRLFGGLSTKEFDGTLGVRFFSKGTAVVTAKDATGTESEYDVVRRAPAEVHADAKIKFNGGYVSGMAGVLLSGQASEQVDEFSTRYVVTPDGKKKRETGIARINTNTYKFGVGGRFDPVKVFGIMAALQYQTSAAAQDAYVMPEQENLGGLRFDLGGEVNIQKFRGMLDFGYVLESSTSYTVEDNDRSATSVDRTLKPALAKGDKVKVSQGALSVTLGGGLAI